MTLLHGINGPSIQTLLGGESDLKQPDEFQATGVSLCPGINIWAYSLTALPFSGMNGHPEFLKLCFFLCIMHG